MHFRYNFNLEQLKNKQNRNTLKLAILNSQFDKTGFLDYELNYYKTFGGKINYEHALMHSLIMHAGDEKFDIWCDFLTKNASSCNIEIKLIKNDSEYLGYNKNGCPNCAYLTANLKNAFWNNEYASKRFEKLLTQEFRKNIKTYAKQKQLADANLTKNM